ncbi:MAG TPA: hypothetical protein VN175_05220 [Rhizomicrobium sp.]|nr:hypothetical protein [Rhizomicrobium sp.]
MRYAGQAYYYREQASRVRKRADLAYTQEARASLLDFAQRWERLAVEAEQDTVSIDWIRMPNLH